MELRRSALVTFGYRIAAFLIGVASSVALARLLGPADRGRYAVLILFPTILMKVGTAGMEVANVYNASRKKDKLKEIVFHSFLVSLVAGVLLGSLFLVVSRLSVFRTYLASNQINPGLIWPVVSLLPVLVLKQLLNRVLLGAGRIVAFNITETMQAALHMVLVVFLVAIVGLGLLGAVLSYIVSTTLDLIIIVVIVNRISPIRIRLDRGLLKQSIMYGSRAYLGNIAQLLHYRIDSFIISILLKPQDVGFYTIAVGIAERLWIIPNTISTVLLPKVSSSSFQHGTAYTVKSVRHTFYLILSSCVILSIASRPLFLWLYGRDFLEAVCPFRILLIGVLSLSIAKVVTSDLAGKGRPEFGALASIMSLVVNIALNLVLIRVLGIAGASVASSLSYSLATAVVLLSFCKISGTRISSLFQIERQDIQTYRSIVANLFVYRRTRRP